MLYAKEDQGHDGFVILGAFRSWFDNLPDRWQAGLTTNGKSDGYDYPIRSP